MAVNYGTKIIVLLIVILISVGFGCSKKTSEQPSVPSQPAVQDSQAPSNETNVENTPPTNTVDIAKQQFPENSTHIISNTTNTKVKTWLTQELTDVTTEKSFTIGQYKGKNVLIQSFGVNCNTCNEQIQHLKTFSQTFESSVEIITLSMDLEETADQLKQFVTDNTITWQVVPSSSPITTVFLKKWGITFIDPTNKQMVLWCDSLRSKVIKGVKTPEQLQKEVSDGCK